jgi:hypothetical protein
MYKGYEMRHIAGETGFSKMQITMIVFGIIVLLALSWLGEHLSSKNLGQSFGGNNNIGVQQINNAK